MRVVLFAALMLAAASASAQTVPSTTPPTVTKASSSAVHAKKRHVARVSRPVDPLGNMDAAPLPDTPIAKPVASGAAVPAKPDDPLSLGMKWNANSDSARETRVQNYRGDAPGEGAEVGVKLHF